MGRLRAGLDVRFGRVRGRLGVDGGGIWGVWEAGLAIAVDGGLTVAVAVAATAATAAAFDTDFPPFPPFPPACFLITFVGFFASTPAFWTFFALVDGCSCMLSRSNAACCVVALTRAERLGAMAMGSLLKSKSCRAVLVPKHMLMYV